MSNKKELKDVIVSKQEYMKNCLFWLQNYVDNDITDNRVLETLNSLEKHINEIRAVFNKKKSTTP